MTDKLHRRDFLRLGGALAATALGAVRADEPKKRTIHKAIMYGTLTYKGSVLEQFRAVKAAGFEGVEPMSHMNQDEVLKAFDETGLKAASCCCATHWDKRLSDPDENVRQEAREGVERALQHLDGLLVVDLPVTDVGQVVEDLALGDGRAVVELLQEQRAERLLRLFDVHEAGLLVARLGQLEREDAEVAQHRD